MANADSTRTAFLTISAAASEELEKGIEGIELLQEFADHLINDDGPEAPVTAWRVQHVTALAIEKIRAAQNVILNSVPTEALIEPAQ